jgi:hypothetical protein
MRRRRLLVLLALVVVLSASGLPVVGCQVAADTSSSSTTAKPVQATEGAFVTSTVTTHSSTTEARRSIEKQRQRFSAVSDLAQHYGWAAIDYKAPQSPDWNAELIVHGTVVKVDPARWNTPDGGVETAYCQ